MISILQGDCREVLRTLAAGSVDCIVADPPYGETSLPWDKWVPGWPDLCRRILKPTGSLWCFGSMRMFMEHRLDFQDWRMAQDVIWEKHNGTSPFNDRFRRVHEHAVQFYCGDWAAIWKQPQFTNDAVARRVRRKKGPPHWGWGQIDESSYESHDGGPRLMRSVMFVRSENGSAVHPTQKPVELLKPLIAYSCPEWGTVLDPFAGSGSTGIAARIMSRNAVLIEANAEYAEIARVRIRDDAPLLSERNLP